MNLNASVSSGRMRLLRSAISRPLVPLRAGSRGAFPGPKIGAGEANGAVETFRSPVDVVAPWFVPGRGLVARWEPRLWALQCCFEHAR